MRYGIDGKLNNWTQAIVFLTLQAPTWWFVSYAKSKYHMDSFNVADMRWFDVLFFIAIVAVCLVGTLGMCNMNSEVAEMNRRLAELERIRREPPAIRAELPRG